MIILEATNETLELQTSSTAAIDVVVSYADDNGTTLTAGSQETAITTATTTIILAAPAASTQRQVKLIALENKGTTTNTITFKKDVGGTEYVIRAVTLKAGESSVFTQANGFTKYTANGELATVNTTDRSAPISSTSFNVLKVGTTAEAIGVWHSHHAATGTPGAWSPGTPGINGRATDGTAAPDIGCIPVKNPATGANYITSAIASATTAGFQMLLDILWVNSGIVVTTTTAQAISPVTLPARDATGTTNGNDVMAGILVTTATTNASAITNTTLSYTDQDGNAGATAIMASFPATAQVGTIVPFQLAAGDTGIRSVQSITLGTSYGGGAISLVLFRIIDGVPVLVANTGGVGQNLVNNKNIRLFNGVTLIPAYIPTATTATTVTWAINVEEK